jgi:hypothetical protein
LLIGRKQAHDQRRPTHEGDGQREECAATDPVTDHAERQAANRPREKPKRENGERQ